MLVFFPTLFSRLALLKEERLVPGVQKIVYSTCSIHATENEEVVCQVLESEEATSGGFVLAPRNLVLPTWHRRGLREKMSGTNGTDVLDRIF